MGQYPTRIGKIMEVLRSIETEQESVVRIKAAQVENSIVLLRESERMTQSDTDADNGQIIQKKCENRNIF